MLQWQDGNSNLWTTRASDEWQGDGSFVQPSPLSLSYDVKDHNPGTLTNVYQEMHLQANLQLLTAHVEVSTIINTSVQGITQSLLTSDLIIDTACHIETLTIQSLLNAHSGQLATIAFQSVKPHIQFTPKNPIVISDITVYPSTLSLEADVATPVYGGDVQAIYPDALHIDTTIYTFNPRIDTQYEVSAALNIEMTYYDILDVFWSFTHDEADPPELRASVNNVFIESTCQAEPGAISLGFYIQNFFVVIEGYAMQDDLPLSIDLRPADIWHDNNVSVQKVDELLFNVLPATASRGARINADCVQVILDVPDVDTFFSCSTSIDSCLALSTSLKATDVWHDNVISVQADQLTLSVIECATYYDLSVDVGSISMSTDVCDMDTSFTCLVSPDVTDSLTAVLNQIGLSIITKYETDSAISMAFEQPDAVVSYDSSFDVSAQDVSITLIKPEYAGQKVREYILLESGIQTEALLSTPIDTYSEAPV